MNAVTGTQWEGGTDNKTYLRSKYSLQRSEQCGAERRILPGLTTWQVRSIE